MYCNCMSKYYIALYQFLFHHFYVDMHIEQHQMSVANAHPLLATTTDIKDRENCLMRWG